MPPSTFLEWMTFDFVIVSGLLLFGLVFYLTFKVPEPVLMVP